MRRTAVRQQFQWFTVNLAMHAVESARGRSNIADDAREAMLVKHDRLHRRGPEKPHFYMKRRTDRKSSEIGRQRPERSLRPGVA
jgi:hypothetical protein